MARGAGPRQAGARCREPAGCTSQQSWWSATAIGELVQARSKQDRNGDDAGSPSAVAGSAMVASSPGSLADCRGSRSAGIKA